MKKFGLSLLGLTAIMAVTGCNATSSSTKGAEKYKVPATDLIINYKSFVLQVGESVDLDVEIRPLAAFDATLIFESSDLDVASVDKDGLVTAVGSGYSLVSVKTENYVDDQSTPDLIETCKIYVTEPGTRTQKTALLNEMKSYQAAHCGAVDNLVLYDYRVYDLICEGKSQDRSTEKQIYAVSVPNGLISYDSEESYIHTTDGGTSYEKYGYTFQTKSSYGSYAYHRNETVKNMFYIATEFNLGSEFTRFDTACAVVDSYFSVNHDYFTGGLDDVLSTDWFDDFKTYSRIVDKFGSYRTDDEFCISYRLVQSYDDEFSIEDEVRYATQLPAGIAYDVDEGMQYTWVNGYLVDMYYYSLKTFKWEGKNYQYNIELSQHFDIVDNATISRYIPDDSQYKSVEYWYDI